MLKRINSGYMASALLALLFSVLGSGCNPTKMKEKTYIPPPQGGGEQNPAQTPAGSCDGHKEGDTWDGYSTATDACLAVPNACTCNGYTSEAGKKTLQIECPAQVAPSQAKCTASITPPVGTDCSKGTGQCPPPPAPPPPSTNNGFPIYGVFDRGSEHLQPRGGHVMDVHYYGDGGGSAGEAYDHPNFSNKRVIVRLDYKNGNQSNPSSASAEIKSAIANKVKNSGKVWAWVVGNEPNLENVSPDAYAAFFKAAAQEIRNQYSEADRKNFKIIMAPLSPNAPAFGGSIAYQNTIIDLAGDAADGFCVQGKTRSAQFPTGKTAASSDDLWAAFLNHREAIKTKTGSSGKPVIICELGPHTDSGTAWGQDPNYLKNAYTELVNLNKVAGYNPIVAGIAFRFDGNLFDVSCNNGDWTFCAHEDVFKSAYALDLKGP